METNKVLDVVGSLVSQVKAFSSKIPAIVPTASVPGGLKPSAEAVEDYEHTVSRFREQAGEPIYRRLTDLFIDSLEAFESGWVLRAVQTLLTILDHVERMGGEHSITMTPSDEARLREYRNTLHKILPGNEPELKGAGRGL